MKFHIFFWYINTKYRNNISQIRQRIKDKSKLEHDLVELKSNIEISRDQLQSTVNQYQEKLTASNYLELERDLVEYSWNQISAVTFSKVDDFQKFSRRNSEKSLKLIEKLLNNNTWNQLTIDLEGKLEDTKGALKNAKCHEGQKHHDDETRLRCELEIEESKLAFVNSCIDSLVVQAKERPGLATFHRNSNLSEDSHIHHVTPVYTDTTSVRGITTSIPQDKSRKLDSRNNNTSERSKALQTTEFTSAADMIRSTRPQWSKFECPKNDTREDPFASWQNSSLIVSPSSSPDDSNGHKRAHHQQAAQGLLHFREEPSIVQLECDNLDDELFPFSYAINEESDTETDSSKHKLSSHLQSTGDVQPQVEYVVHRTAKEVRKTLYQRYHVDICFKKSLYISGIR